jgi:hypothetical protein
MKGRIALFLALFTLFLSTESSFVLHFCHNKFVNASINKEISTCCKNKDNTGPVVSGICCELSSFDTQLNDTVLNDNNTPVIYPVHFFNISKVSLANFNLKEGLPQHITRPPPKLPKVKLHILYAQYLI